MNEFANIVAALALAAGAHYISAWLWLEIPGAILLTGFMLAACQAMRRDGASARSGSSTSGDAHV